MIGANLLSLLLVLLSLALSLRMDVVMGGETMISSSEVSMISSSLRESLGNASDGNGIGTC